MAAVQKQLFDQKVEAEVEKRMRNSANGIIKKQRFVTPMELKDFLPQKGQGGVYCDRNTSLKRYQAFYPRVDLKKTDSTVIFRLLH
jgi:hypothetical protein